MCKVWAVLCLFFLILFTSSQFEWKKLQYYHSEIEAKSTTSQKLKYISVSQRKESVKEKIILSQERNIQRLHEHVRSLSEQLVQCKAGSDSSKDSKITTNPLAEFLSDFGD